VRAYLFLAVALFLPTFACATSGESEEGAASANLDTSGCTTGQEPKISQGAVGVRGSVPPWRSCWNIPTGGFTASFTWFQQNDPSPQRTNIGFWTSLNGAGVYAKAAAVSCEAVTGITLGHDTSGDRTYRCSAAKTFSFSEFPSLLERAYTAEGPRSRWDVQVAVSLDDDGNWDSLDGANYRFAL
jgi:hypothetical protein